MFYMLLLFSVSGICTESVPQVGSTYVWLTFKTFDESVVKKLQLEIAGLTQENSMLQEKVHHAHQMLVSMAFVFITLLVGLILIVGLTARVKKATTKLVRACRLLDDDHACLYNDCIALCGCLALLVEFYRPRDDLTWYWYRGLREQLLQLERTTERLDESSQQILDSLEPLSLNVITDGEQPVAQNDAEILALALKLAVQYYQALFAVTLEISALKDNLIDTLQDDRKKQSQTIAELRELLCHYMSLSLQLFGYPRVPNAFQLVASEPDVTLWLDIIRNHSVPPS